MNITLDGYLLEQIVETLKAATIELENSRKLINSIQGDRLLTEAEAQKYLKRDAETLRYYRRLGLNSFKKGKDRWYLKADLDDWLASGKVSRHSR